MEILLSITYALFFMFVISRVRFFGMDEIPVRFLRAGYLVKLLAGVTIGLLYTFYYTDRLTADTFRLFDDSKIIFDACFTNRNDFFRMITGIQADAPELSRYYNAMNNWYDIYSPINDNRTMIRFNALLRFVSMGHYYVHVVIISFLSFTGLVAMVKVFKEKCPHLTSDIYVVLLLLPSLLLWVSGLLKDSLAFFTLGMTIYFFSKLIKANGFRYKNIIWLIVFMAGLMFSKFQIFILCLPLLTAWLISEKARIHPWIAFPSVMVVTTGMLLITGQYNPSLDISSMLSAKQQAFYNLGIQEKAGSLISIPRLEPDMLSVLKNAPAGFLSALTRPYPTDPGPLLSKLFTIENILIIGFIFWNLLKRKTKFFSDDPALVFCLFYGIVYLSVIGMVTPVLGAMVRYKAQALPFLIIWALTVNSKNKPSITANWFNKSLN